MNVNIFSIFGQYLIYCILFINNQYVYISVHGLIGHNIRSANSDEYTFIVSIAKIAYGQPHSNGTHFCMGTLITDKDILTSAHCLNDDILNIIQVVVGTIDLRNGRVSYPFWWMSYDQWLTQNNMNIDFYMNDIAVLRLITPVMPHICPAQFSSLLNHDLYRKEVRIPGWGLNNHGNTPDILQMADVIILTNTACQRRVEELEGRRVEVNIRILCTAASPYILLESGDSGGPLIYQNKVVAVNKGTSPFLNVSFHIKQVNIHVGVEFYLTFIEQMKNNS